MMYIMRKMVRGCSFRIGCEITGSWVVGVEEVMDYALRERVARKNQV